MIEYTFHNHDEEVHRMLKDAEGKVIDHLCIANTNPVLGEATRKIWASYIVEALNKLFEEKGELIDDQEEITMVRADDWVGLYSGGVLMQEGHNLTIGDVLNLVGVKTKTLYADSAWLEAEGQLPMDLCEVRQERKD